MTDTPLPGDIRAAEPDEPDVIDDEEHADPDQPDIGTDDPFADGDEEDDTVPDEEIDDLPEVGPMDPDEEPVLDELTEEEAD